MSTLKTPRMMRAFQIGFGIIIVFLSLIVISHPFGGFLSFVWILGILLFVTGIETIIRNIYRPFKSCFAGISLGIAIIILAIIATAFPLTTSIIVISILGIALLFSGISRIIEGINEKHNRNWKWGFIIAAGAIALLLAIMILIFPVVGIVYAGILIGISLLVTGVQMIFSGLSGRMGNKKGLR
jgi:uncharacterized membrane protein HdeD (DUF308 family)